MVEHELFKQKLQAQLDELNLTEEEQDRLVTELDELACILIDACRARDAGVKS
jgi:heme oxygenase